MIEITSDQENEFNHLLPFCRSDNYPSSEDAILNGRKSLMLFKRLLAWWEDE